MSGYIYDPTVDNTDVDIAPKNNIWGYSGAMEYAQSMDLEKMFLFL